MKIFHNKYLPVGLLILLSVGILYYNFQRVLACPECYLFEDAGDGLKNYFTFSWYVLKDQGTHFSGMNYPYGEHIFFTDNHPGLAIFFNFLHRHGIDLNGHTIGIINVLLIISLLLSCLVLYRIFRLLTVGRYTSVAFALVITFLSPQIARFTGHFSLGYVVIVPLFVLIFLKFHLSEVKSRWALLGILWVVFAGFIHLYYFLMMSVFTAFYFIVTFIKSGAWRQIRSKNKKVVIRLAWITSILVVPAIVLLSFLKISDSIGDRPTTPWRGMGLNAKFHGTFIPNYGPFPDYWNDLFNTTPPDTEAMTYVGLVGFFMIPTALFFLIRGRRKKRNSGLPSDTMHTFLWSALGVWVIAAGVLYSPIFSWLLDLVPKLKQFRGMGRLAWMFYYVYTIFIGYYMYRLNRFLAMKGIRMVGKYILVLSVLLLGFEGYLVNRPILNSIYKDNQYLNIKNKTFSTSLDKNGYQPSDFQAILQLPLINLGGETSGVSRGNWTMRKGIQAAFETGLPMIDWSLSRTSVSQSVDFLQLLSSSAVEKERVKMMDQKPLLVVCEENLITEAEKRLVQKSTFIAQIETIRLYRLEMSAFHQNLDEWKALIDSSQSWAPPIVHHNFEQDLFPDALVGDGALIIDHTDDPVFSFTFQKDSVIEAIVHAWMYIDNIDASMGILRIRETNPDGRVMMDQGLHRRDIDWSEVIGQWVRQDRTLQLKPNHKYDFIMETKGNVIDILEVRDRNSNSLKEYQDQRIKFIQGVMVRE
jgi:hypothetical protein